MRKPNDVGAAWKKTNDFGDYLSISLDVDVLLALAGGQVSKMNLNAYPIEVDRETHPNAPDYQLKYYPPRSGVGAGVPLPTPVTREARTTLRQAPPRPLARQAPPQDLEDDDIPF